MSELRTGSWKYYTPPENVYDWRAPVLPYEYDYVQEIKKDIHMAKDVYGKELKVGDTVEVIDGSGDRYFNSKVGAHYFIVEIKDRGSDNTLVYVEDILTGHKYGQFSKRFKRIDKMTYKVGTKLKYKYDDKTDYFVEYVNADGALLYYVNSGFIKYYFFLDNKGLTEYSEIKPEQWVYMYKDSYGKVYVSSFFTSREDAEKAGRSNYETSGRFISVVRTDKTE